MDRRVLDDTDATLPGELLLRAWDVAAEMSGDDAFGLHAGEAAPIGVYDVLDYAMVSSKTFREALDRTTRYYRIVSDNAEVRLDVDGKLARFVYRARAATAPWRHAAECFFAVAMARTRVVLGAEWTPEAVHFAHAAPADVREHERIFRAPLRFDHATSEILFDASVLARPLPSADPALGGVVVRYAEELVARTPADDNPIDRARALVEGALRGGDPSLDEIAARLGMSARTLQRKLTSAGTSWSKLIDDVRHELALRHLDDPKIALGEIAFLLGFAQPNAFHRAFRRWTGKTPASYRADPSRAPGKSRDGR